MSDADPPSTRSNPLVFTSLITAALAAAVLAGASLSSVASGAAQDMLRAAGFGSSAEIQAEQRRHTRALERIELAVGRVQADIALLNARIEDAGDRGRDAPNAAPVNRASGNPAPDNPGQVNPTRRGPEFDLGALRASFEAGAVMQGTGASRQHPRRAGKGVPDVRI
jgi:hypothetical protein